SCRPDRARPTFGWPDRRKSSLRFSLTLASFAPAGRQLGMRTSIDLRHEIPTGQRRLIVIRVLVRTLGKFHLFQLDFLVWNQFEKMRNQVQPCPFLVV